MEFLKLLGLFGLLTLDAALMEFSWLGYALWRDYRNYGLSFDRTRSVAPTPVFGIRTLALVEARDRSEDSSATNERTARLAA
jgi:hypothetical protein